jgi:hypothetical protein
LEIHFGQNLDEFATEINDLILKTWKKIGKKIKKKNQI